MADVVLKDVRKSFGSTEVIHGVDLEIRHGEFVVFVGPSGCGKSTLLRLIAGLEDIATGEIWIDGAKVNDLPPAQRRIAMVFQTYALYPHMNVYENMAFGLELAKFSKAEIDDRVRRTAAMLQIDTLLDRKPKELSGGQRQRVAIGRAIVRDPKVFLFDEPLSNLDAALRVQMRIEIAKLHADTGATMIYVTHDQVEAMTLADRIVVLNAGRVEQVGAPLDLYHRPANLFVAGFLGSPQMNFIKGEIAAAGPDGVQFKLPRNCTILVPVEPGATQPGERVTLGIRPDHVSVMPPGEGLFPGRILVVEELGENHLIHVDAAGLRLTARAPGASDHRAGEEIGIGFDGASCHLFGTSGEALPRLEPIAATAPHPNVLAGARP
jgi:multiple sugar transport system ATP-binding protein